LKMDDAMDIRVVMLGTSGSTPTKARGMPAVAVVYEGSVYLFDCGEGTQMKMMKYGINMSKIEAIFITHAHGDHILGIAGLVRTLALNKRTTPLTIFVPKGYEKTIQTLISFDRALISYPIEVKGVTSGTVYKGAGIKVSAFKLVHTIPACGYVFSKEEKRRFDKEKCRKLGIKGKMFAELEARKRIKIDGRLVKLGDVTYEVGGKKIVYASDTRPAAGTIRASGGADLLIHEATYLERDIEKAKKRGHSTAAEAASVARKAKVKMLVLTHISARYRSTIMSLNEAKKGFDNVIVARDGYVINL